MKYRIEEENNGYDGGTFYRPQLLKGETWEYFYPWDFDHTIDKVFSKGWMGEKYPHMLDSGYFSEDRVLCYDGNKEIMFSKIEYAQLFIKEYIKYKEKVKEERVYHEVTT